MLFAVLLCLCVVGAQGWPTVLPQDPPCEESHGQDGCWRYGVMCSDGQPLAWDDWSECNKCFHDGSLYDAGEVFMAGDEECMCPEDDGVNYGGNYRDAICIPVDPMNPLPPSLPPLNPLPPSLPPDEPLNPLPPTLAPVEPTTEPSCQPWSQSYGCWVIGGACLHGKEFLWTDWSGCPNWLKKKFAKLECLKDLNIKEGKMLKEN